MRLLLFILSILLCLSHICLSEPIDLTKAELQDGNNGIIHNVPHEEKTNYRCLSDESNCFNERRLKSKKKKKNGSVVEGLDDSDLQQYIRTQSSLNGNDDNDEAVEKKKKKKKKSTKDSDEATKSKGKGKFLRKEKEDIIDDEMDEKAQQLEERLAELKRKLKLLKKRKEGKEYKEEVKEEVKERDIQIEETEVKEKEEEAVKEETVVEETEEEAEKEDVKEEKLEKEEEVREEKLEKEEEVREEKLESEEVKEEKLEKEEEKSEVEEIKEEAKVAKPDIEKEEVKETKVEVEEAEEVKVKKEEPVEETKDEEPNYVSLSFTVETEDNTIIVYPNLAATPSMRLACVTVLKGDTAPNQIAMMRKIELFGQTVVTQKGKNRIVLKTNDIHLLQSVLCMGFNQEENTYYGPTELKYYVKPPPAPEIDVRPIEVTPISVEIYIKSNLECRVWCVQTDRKANLTIANVKETQYRYVRERGSIYFSDLMPETDYAIWCYAETKGGIAMNESLQEKRVEVTTKKTVMKIEKMEVTKNSISFNLNSNLNQEVKCSLMDAYGDLVTSASVSVFKSNHVYFKSLSSHSLYYLNCQVFSKHAKEVMLLAETKPIEIQTKRSILGTLFVGVVVIMAVSMVLLVVLAVIKYRMDHANQNTSDDLPENQSLLTSQSETTYSQPPSVLSTEDTWRCTVSIGQYLNRGNGERCSMCNIKRAGSVTANLAELEEGDMKVDQPIVKKSKIGTGMRLGKEKRTAPIPKKVVPAEVKVENSDIFSEVGLDVKVEVGNRSATMLNKSMVPPTIHVNPSPIMALSEPEQEVNGTGWDDDDLDL